MTHRIPCEPHYITHNPLHKGSHATLPITSSFMQQTVTERQLCDQSLAQELVVSGTDRRQLLPSWTLQSKTRRDLNRSHERAFNTATTASTTKTHQAKCSEGGSGDGWTTLWWRSNPRNCIGYKVNLWHINHSLKEDDALGSTPLLVYLANAETVKASQKKQNLPWITTIYRTSTTQQAPSTAIINLILLKTLQSCYYPRFKNGRSR